MTEKKDTPQMRTEVKRKPGSEKPNLSVDVEVGVHLSSFGCVSCSSAYRVTLVNTDNPTRSRMEARISHENKLSDGVGTLVLGLQ